MTEDNHNIFYLSLVKGIDYLRSQVKSGNKKKPPKLSNRDIHQIHFVIFVDTDYKYIYIIINVLLVQTCFSRQTCLFVAKLNSTGLDHKISY